LACGLGCYHDGERRGLEDPLAVISPHEAGIAEGKPGNTIGNQFYGSKGSLVMDEDKYFAPIRE
jgi:hypothetical protein